MPFGTSKEFPAARLPVMDQGTAGTAPSEGDSCPWPCCSSSAQQAPLTSSTGFACGCSVSAGEGNRSLFVLENAGQPNGGADNRSLFMQQLPGFKKR